MEAYKTVRDYVVLLKHRRGHLCVYMVVMLDEGFIAQDRKETLRATLHCMGKWLRPFLLLAVL